MDIKFVYVHKASGVKVEGNFMIYVITHRQKNSSFNSYTYISFLFYSFVYIFYDGALLLLMILLMLYFTLPCLAIGVARLNNEDDNKKKGFKL